MKTTRTIFALALSMATALSGLVAAAPARAITLDLTLSSATATVGDTLTATLAISGLTGPPDPPSLAAWDVDIAFDPSVLAFSTAAFGPELGGCVLSLCGASISSPGVLDANETSLLNSLIIDAAQIDAFTLATFAFTAIGPGTSSLDLSVQILTDTSIPPAPLTATLGQSPSVRVSGPAGGPTVPEPATLLLLGSGLAAVGLGARWRARAGHKKTA